MRDKVAKDLEVGLKAQIEACIESQSLVQFLQKDKEN